MSNKQRLILIGIFVVTFVIGLTSIVVLNVISSPKKNTQVLQASSQVPNFTTDKLYCTSTNDNKSLTLIWEAPNNLPNNYVVYGQMNDASTQADPVAFGPITVSQGGYIFTSSNGIDTYSASLWIQAPNGSKSTIASTNQINSSLCTSGSQPTPPLTSGTVAATTSTPSPTQTTVPVPTKASGRGGTLSCNSFSVTQNSAAVSGTIAPGSGAVTIASGITAGSGSIVYTNASWNISPNIPALNVSNDGSSATWNPPTNTSNGSKYTITLSGVTDTAGDSLSAPCTVNLILASTLPSTAGNTPTVLLLILGLSLISIGTFLFLKINSEY